MSHDLFPLLTEEEYPDFTSPISHDGSTQSIEMKPVHEFALGALFICTCAHANPIAPAAQDLSHEGLGDFALVPQVEFDKSILDTLDISSLDRRDSTSYSITPFVGNRCNGSTTGTTYTTTTSNDRNEFCARFPTAHSLMIRFGTCQQVQMGIWNQANCQGKELGYYAQFQTSEPPIGCYSLDVKQIFPYHASGTASCVPKGRKGFTNGTIVHEGGD